MTQPTFDMDFPSPKRARGEGEHGTKAAEVKKGVVWTRIPETVAKPKCDQCVADMEAGGKWKAPDPVRWRRSDSTTITYLCFRHGLERKDRDGIDPDDDA